jgi:hypothetical protein
MARAAMGKRTGGSREAFGSPPGPCVTTARGEPTIV